MLLIVFSAFIITFFRAESTNIAAVYGNSILYLRDADTIKTADSKIAGDLYLKLSENLSYPVALTYDPSKRNLYVADINNRENHIFQLNLDEDLINVKPILPKIQQTAIETMIWDPVKKSILWSDRLNGIFQASFSEDFLEWTEKIIIKRDKFKPRGLTLDHCHRFLYFTDRFHKKRTLEKYNLNDKTFSTVKEARRSEYFQGIDYNGETEEIYWAVTNHDDETNSSCEIYRQHSSNSSFLLLATFENCYPFSMTSDANFIYWSDWGRNGIMRMSKQDPNNLVKLVDTPAYNGTSYHGEYNGAFGIINIDRNYSLSCYRQVSESPISIDEVEVNDLHLSQAAMDLQQLPSNDLQPSATASAAAQSIYGNTSTCHRQRFTIIILSFTSILFLSTTVLLLARRYCSLRWSKNSKIHCSSSVTVAPRVRKHRKFGSAMKNKIVDDILCPRDRLEIDIEDCCQMTLCDSPCYTSIKKEGKGYMTKDSTTTKTKQQKEDKKNLLDNDFLSV